MVSALVVGAASAAQIVADVTAMQAKVPDAFWEELKASGLIEAGAPTPPPPAA